MYGNQGKATLRRSIHPSGKVANLSEMSIAWILEFGSGSLLSAEKVGRCVRQRHSFSPRFPASIRFTPAGQPDIGTRGSIFGGIEHRFSL